MNNFVNSNIFFTKLSRIDPCEKRVNILGGQHWRYFFMACKGQIISEYPYEIIVYPKIATKKFPRFLPWPLRRGQTKNFIKPIMLNNP